MNVLLPVKDLKAAVAGIAIAYKKTPSTMALILAALMEHADNGVITHPIPVGAHITKDLSITPENYRKCIRRLMDLNLISKDHSMLLLAPMINKMGLATSLILRQHST